MWGMPQSIHKFYAIKDKAAIRRGAVISTVFSAIVGCGAYFMGSMITRFVSEVPDGNFDRLVPTMIVENLPSALLGLIIVLLFSASMSTLAALSLSSSSTVTVDFYKGYIRKKAPESDLNIMIRVLCLVFVAVSAVLAIVEVDAIVSMMSLSWGAIAGCFMGPYVYGLYSRKANKVGAYSSSLTSPLLTFTHIVGLAQFRLPRVSRPPTLARPVQPGQGPYVYGLYSRKANKAGAYAAIITSLLLTFSLIVGLGYFVLRADGGDPTFGEAFKAGIGQSPFIGVVTMAASMVVTPVVNLIFAKKCAVSKELLDAVFPAKLPVNEVYVRASVK
mgnify:CR=1 FL=1